MAGRYASGHDVVGRAGSGGDQISLTGTPLPIHVPMGGVESGWCRWRLRRRDVRNSIWIGENMVPWPHSN
jgi:hypothetical protein